ncbi:MAG: hypothetical protein KBD78_00260 [Oligoflexales bacterium]|nr:hypothetical protein [Oligoflexales bacterium]
MSDSFEGLRQDCVRLHACLLRVTEDYSQAATYLQTEQQALRISDLAVVESLAQPKKKLAAKIELESGQIFSLILAIKKQLESENLIDQQTPGPLTVSEVLAVMQTLQEHRAFGGEVDHDVQQESRMQLVITDLASAIYAFKDAMLKYQNIYNVHAIVVQKGLRNVRQSYQFWQDFAAEADATYNAAGMQKQSEQNSIFKVKV